MGHGEGVMIRNLTCQCGCGEQTAFVNLPPGSLLDDPHPFFITGHAWRGSAYGHNYKLIDITKRRKADMLNNAIEAVKVTAARIR